MSNVLYHLDVTCMMIICLMLTFKININNMCLINIARYMYRQNMSWKCFKMGDNSYINKKTTKLSPLTNLHKGDNNNKNSTKLSPLVKLFVGNLTTSI